LSPSTRELETGRTLRRVHFQLTFLLAAIVLVLDLGMTLLELNGGFDPLRLGVLGSLALVAMTGLEMERHHEGRTKAPHGWMLGIAGLLEVGVCLRTGGIASPYYLLVASTCVFAALTLPVIRGMYLTALVTAAYVLGVVVATPGAGGPTSATTVAALAVHAAFVFLATSLAARISASGRKTVAVLEVQSQRDPLTALENRRAFLQKFEGELQRAERFSWPVTMLVIDLDFFKKLNDVYGHAVGDQVLVETADLLREVAGALDHIARVGGEEFAVAAVAAEPYHGRDLADRIVRAFRLRAWSRIRPGMKVTCSVGVAVLPPGLHSASPTAVIGELMERADRALYHVKQHGRDNFHVSEESAPALMR
jgi:diguanylate cyclase (GGDEF)-like protein